MRKYSGLSAAAFVAVFATLILSGCGYNDLQRQDEQVKSAWSESGSRNPSDINFTPWASRGMMR